MSTIPIKLKPKPYYLGFKKLDGAKYRLTVYWNVNTSKWYLSMQGLSNDVDIKGMALMCGKNLVRPYGYRELGELWLIDNGDADEDPNFDDIGERWTLEYTPRSD